VGYIERHEHEARSDNTAEIREALEAVAQAKNLSVETLLEAMATGMLAAYKKQPDSAEEAEVRIDADTFEIRIMAQELDDEGAVMREWDDTPGPESPAG